MTEPLTQSPEDLTDAIARAMRVSLQNGLVETEEEFLADFESEERVAALLDSADENDVAYGEILHTLRDSAQRMAAAVAPVPTMVEAGAGPIDDAYVGIQDGAYVEDPPSPAPTQASNEASVPAAAPSSPAEEPVRPYDGAMRDKVAGLLSLLSTAPVAHLRLPSVEAANIASPFELGDEQKLLVLRIIAPLMRAAGIVEVAVQPSYFDVARGKDVELDLGNDGDLSVFIRDALRR